MRRPEPSSLSNDNEKHPGCVTYVVVPLFFIFKSKRGCTGQTRNSKQYFLPNELVCRYVQHQRRWSTEGGMYVHTHCRISVCEYIAQKLVELNSYELQDVLKVEAATMQLFKRRCALALTQRANPEKPNIMQKQDCKAHCSRSCLHYNNQGHE